VELADIKILEDQSRDEVTGDHKENVHAHISASATEVGVKKQHRQDGDGPEAVHIGAIFKMRAVR
jgi:hypothetical protein